jgi:UDP-N-acetylglucosamine--N-acetylmuramyl-(pentapeptide) pyrophosphoryl-undecaprenol N-acetylglucosamine transferase
MNAPVLILAGGTGGHIFPGIAVARALAAHAVDVVWLGSAQGLENRLVPAAGIALERVAVKGLRGKGIAALLAAPWQLARAVLQSVRVVRRRRPRLAIAFGGFVAGPGAIAALLGGVPLVVHEQNRVPGWTNRILARLACRVLQAFPGAFERGAETVGNPVRAEIAALPAPMERLAARSGALRILVLGGSQGARALNQAMPEALAALASDTAFEVRHQAGAAGLDTASANYARAGVAATIEPFLDDMAAAYRWADVVVCRAGALTLAELCAAGVASILVPFPFAVDDHQTRNAEYLVERGAAVLLPESHELAPRLANALREFAADRAALLGMAEAARRLAAPDAAERIAAIGLAEARA